LCTFPTRLSQPLLPWCSFCSNGQVKTKTRPFRTNPSDQPGRVPSYNSLPPFVRLAEFSQLIWSRQSPYDSWLHWKLHDLNVSNLFVPGWPSFKWDTRDRHRDDSGVTTQHKSILPIPPRCFINLLVFLVFKNIVFILNKRTCGIPTTNSIAQISNLHLWCFF
jgi:hypothetical protein